MASRRRSDAAPWSLAVVAAAGLVAALVYYFLPRDGIDGTLGAAIVIGSTALMLIAAAAIALGWARGASRALLSFLILLDILGTGFAAYMLEADILLGLMALAFVAWLWSLSTGRPETVPAPAGAAL